MLKDILNEKKLSIYQLANESGVPYSTVNDLINGKIDIDNCKVGTVKKIADALSMSLDQLYELCSPRLNYICVFAGRSYSAEMLVRAKHYYHLIYDDSGKAVYRNDIGAVNRYSSKDVTYRIYVDTEHYLFDTVYDAIDSSSHVKPYKRPEDLQLIDTKSINVWNKQTYTGNLLLSSDRYYIEIWDNDQAYLFAMCRKNEQTEKNINFTFASVLKGYAEKIYEGVYGSDTRRYAIRVAMEK